MMRLKVPYALWASRCDLRDPGWGDPGFPHCWLLFVFAPSTWSCFDVWWLSLAWLQDPIHFLISSAHKLPCMFRARPSRRWVLCLFVGFGCLLFVLCFLLFVLGCFLFGLVFFSLLDTPVWTCWTVYWSTLSFDSPMREHTGLCTIRSMARTLCYDLARAEKAKDGKKTNTPISKPAMMCTLPTCHNQVAELPNSV